MDGYDYNTGKFIDYSEQFDIATTNNPYDAMAHDFFKVSYWVREKGVPMFYISYCYMGRSFWGIDCLKSETFSYFWKIFSENQYVLKLAKKYEIIKGENVVVSGYPKMDTLANIKINDKNKKMIIIAPHHTIDNSERAVGGFLQFSDIILQLPKKYPNIDFVFRPHPLLFENLNTKYWGKEKTDKYLSELLSNSNITYSEEGNYLELFANSNALIHDCSSYTAEYLYTGKPCAFMYRKDLNPNCIWTDFGKSCIKSHYLIKNNLDLDLFIDNVIIKGNDYLKMQRDNFAKEQVMLNYPNSTDYIVNYLTSQFK